MPLPLPEAVQELIKSFKEASSSFSDAFGDFAGAGRMRSVAPFYPQYLEKLDKVMDDIYNKKEEGYILDFSLDDGTIKLLDAPTEEELQDNFTFKRYSDIRDIYKNLVEEIRSVT